MGDISRNFSFSEFERSDTAKRCGFDNRIPNESIKAAICKLVLNVLQPLRNAWGLPLSLNSGYRCLPLNEAVGSKPNSQHCKGEAADVRCANPYKMAMLARSLNLPFDQMILYPNFVHFSHKKSGEQRRQIIYNKSYKGKRL